MKIQPSDFLLARFADSAGPILRWLGRIEPKLTRHNLATVPIEKPVFIAGLARSGTTILLELLSTIDGAATHRYRDFPFVMTPLLWNAFLKLVSRPQAPAERAHRDRIQITPESPEAFEEPIWKAFFPDCHAPRGRHVLTAADQNDSFDDFFREHLRKILLLRKGNRYLSKGNYNVTRIEYLARLFPDARFVVPIRHPFTHVHSLVRQHQLFCSYAAEDPQVPDYLRAVGHYEFGPQRLPVQVTAGAAERIRAAWSAGNDELGYAIQWAEIYGYVDRLRRDRPDLAERVLIVRYEDFCSNPREIMNRILEHIQVDPVQAQRVYAQLSGISLSAHVPTFSETVTQAIMEQVKDVATRFGYVIME